MSNHTFARTSTAALLISTIAAFGVAGLSGCKSSTEKAEGAAVTTAKSFRQDLSKLPASIDTTVQRLAKVVSAQNAGRAGDFEVFGRNLADLREQARRVGLEADKAQASSTTYFTEWARDANRATASGAAPLDETLAARTDNNQTALKLLRDGRSSFAQLIGTLDGIEKSLKGKLTDANAAATQPAVSTAIIQATDTRDYIAALTTRIDAALSRR